MLTMRTSEGTGARVVWASGEVDLSTAPRLRAALVGAAAETSEDVVVDLSEVSFMDSTGIGVLASVYRRLNATGRRLIVRAPSERVLLVLQIAGIDQLLGVDTK